MGHTDTLFLTSDIRALARLHDGRTAKHRLRHERDELGVHRAGLLPRRGHPVYDGIVPDCIWPMKGVQEGNSRCKGDEGEAEDVRKGRQARAR